METTSGALGDRGTWWKRCCRARRAPRLFCSLRTGWGSVIPLVAHPSPRRALPAPRPGKVARPADGGDRWRRRELRGTSSTCGRGIAVRFVPSDSRCGGPSIDQPSDPRRLEGWGWRVRAECGAGRGDQRDDPVTLDVDASLVEIHTKRSREPVRPTRADGASTRCSSSRTGTGGVASRDAPSGQRRANTRWRDHVVVLDEAIDQLPPGRPPVTTPVTTPSLVAPRRPTIAPTSPDVPKGSSRMPGAQRRALRSSRGGTPRSKAAIFARIGF